MRKNRNRTTRCDCCQYQGPRVHLNHQVHSTCLRHRRDGEPHILPQDWLDDLAAEEIRCHLYQRAKREAA